jgi:hypothetical protein
MEVSWLMQKFYQRESRSDFSSMRSIRTTISQTRILIVSVREIRRHFIDATSSNSA